MSVYDLKTAAPSKRHGLRLNVGDSFFEANGRVFLAVKTKSPTRCDGCAFRDSKDPANVVICKHVVCAKGWTKDGRAQVFEEKTAKRSTGFKFLLQ